MASLDIKTGILPSVILAPSAHNTQPWQFAVRDDVVDVFVDWSRHLTVSDPTKRELYISIGCAIENARVAAAHHGYGAEVAYFPDGQGEDRPAARISFRENPAGQTDPRARELFDAVPQRRTNRAPYDAKPLTAQEKSKLDTHDPSIVLVEDRQKISAIAKATEEGTFATLSRKDFKAELSRWVRNSWTRRPDGMPGYAIGMPAPVSLLAPVIVKVAPIHKQGGPKARQQMESASAIAVIVTSQDFSQDWIEAGQTMERLWLEATAAGLAAAPLASAIEADEATRMQVKQTGGTNLLPQAILRIGHVATIALKPTPRRTVEDCLKR